jgi:hypothetical protein
MLELEFENFVSKIARILQELDHYKLRALVSNALVEGGEMGDGGYGDEGKTKKTKL